MADKLGLPVRRSDEEAERSIHQAKERKLVLDGRITNLPETLASGWVDGPARHQEQNAPGLGEISQCTKNCRSPRGIFPYVFVRNVGRRADVCAIKQLQRSSKGQFRIAVYGKSTTTYAARRTESSSLGHHMGSHPYILRQGPTVCWLADYHPDETNDGERDREVAADGGERDAGADGGETDGQRNGQRWLKDFSRQRGRGISLGSTVGSRLSCSFWKRTGRDGVSNVVP
ncbi:hypothetical protein BSL78_25933 [Apostichopus japonicus]|uniref:Uncharacterized protein n=1 Tax=Stichopus japonicus TaxID=307972 RepID=A0A2G8JN86_STIJA|nr:hypothetical protein BSL78_25933 [Apostichopus japonicus]